MAIGSGRTAGWVAVGMLMLGQSVLADPPDRREVRATLDVILRYQELSKLTTSVMREEAERIWIREGVQIRWRSSEAEIPSGASFIRLELVDEYAAVAARRSATALGDFQPGVGTIRVSLTSAAETATLGLSVYRKPLQPFDQPLALGYVLGRAIAHEIGHSLLGARHADAGLMQAAFTPGQMVDRLSGSFRLTPIDSSRLYHRLDDGRMTLRVRAPERRSVDLVIDGDDDLAR